MHAQKHHTYPYTHIHTQAHTHRHSHASGPPATPRSHTHRHRHAHALTRANRARPHLLEAALPPLAARADAYTPRCLGSSPAPRLFIALPPLGVQDAIRFPKRLVHFCFFARAQPDPFPPLPNCPPLPQPGRSTARRRSQPSAPLRPASHAPHAPAAATQDAPHQGKDVQAVGATKDDARVVRGCRRLLLLVRRGSVPRDSPRAAAEPG